MMDTCFFFFYFAEINYLRTLSNTGIKTEFKQIEQKFLAIKKISVNKKIVLCQCREKGEKERKKKKERKGKKINNNKQLNLLKKLNDLFVIKSKLDSDIF